MPHNEPENPAAIPFTLPVPDLEEQFSCIGRQCRLLAAFDTSTLAEQKQKLHMQIREHFGQLRGTLVEVTTHLALSRDAREQPAPQPFKRFRSTGEPLQSILYASELCFFAGLAVLENIVMAPRICWNKRLNEHYQDLSKFDVSANVIGLSSSSVPGPRLQILDEHKKSLRFLYLYPSGLN